MAQQHANAGKSDFVEGYSLRLVLFYYPWTWHVSKLCDMPGFHFHFYLRGQQNSLNNFDGNLAFFLRSTANR
jgi:hypothetical protein